MLRTKMLLTTCCLILSISLFAQEATYAVIGASDVKMRSQANTDSELLGLFQLGEVAEILEISDHAEHIAGINDDARCNEYNWYKLNINGKKGWVFGAFVFEYSSSNENEAYDLKNDKSYIVANFFTRPSGGDMCFGENFIAVVPDNIEKIKSVRLIKLAGGKLANYRGMPSLSFEINIAQVFFDKSGNIVVLISGFAPGDYAEVCILELKSNGALGYSASEKYYNSTH